MVHILTASTLPPAAGHAVARELGLWRNTQPGGDGAQGAGAAQAPEGDRQERGAAVGRRPRRGRLLGWPGLFKYHCFKHVSGPARPAFAAPSRSRSTLTPRLGDLKRTQPRGLLTWGLAYSTARFCPRLLPAVTIDVHSRFPFVLAAGAASSKWLQTPRPHARTDLPHVFHCSSCRR